MVNSKNSLCQKTSPINYHMLMVNPENIYTEKYYVNRRDCT